MWKVWIIIESCALMSCHCNVWTCCPLQISKHTNNTQYFQDAFLVGPFSSLFKSGHPAGVLLVALFVVLEISDLWYFLQLPWFYHWVISMCLLSIICWCVWWVEGSYWKIDILSSLCQVCDSVEYFIWFPVMQSLFPRFIRLSMLLHPCVP